MLEHFVRYKSYWDFAHKILFLEQGLVKLNSILNRMPSLTLKAEKSIF